LGALNHVILTVNDLARSKPFYAALMPRLGFPNAHAFGPFLGWSSSGGSFWLKLADPRYAGELFSKDRVGLCEVAFNAENHAQVDSLARDIESFGGSILDPPKEYPEYVEGYYAVFFTDPDGIKLELRCGPVSRSVNRQSWRRPSM
jgi:catechol 2,3-dioxygenase-like lactoylglutathione lyase family enzyme